LQAGAAFGKAFVAASAKNPQTIGLDLISAPRASGNLWSRFNVPSGEFKGLGVGLGVINVGKTWAGDPTTTVYYTLPGWTRVDLAAYYAWNRYSFLAHVQEPARPRVHCFGAERHHPESGRTEGAHLPGDDQVLTRNPIRGKPLPAKAAFRLIRNAAFAFFRRSGPPNLKPRFSPASPFVHPHLVL